MTLLLALAGRLGTGLQMSGSTTYNGHGLNEFVLQRTSAYVSQQDWFAVEMTVRETLDFAGRCQGVGFKYDMLVELARREKIAGIKPDGDLDIFMKSLALGEKETSLVVEYIMKVMIYSLITRGTIEERMMQLTKKKMVLEHLVVGRLKARNINQEELDDIIRYGSKELFADENDEAGKSRQIHYDDAAIERLLDREQAGDDDTPLEEGDEDGFLKAFKPDKNDKDLDRASERQDLEGKELKQETTLHELELVAVHALHELVSLVHSHVNAAGQYDFE